MKYSELIAELKAAGCFLVRHGSKHDMWFSPITGKRFPVPRHASHEVAKTTEKSIRKLAGI
ncbi:MULTISPECIES: type II toxin-antitoxin system HicA family toxin [unclassified Parabacteroides]|uniref:type II toxin-antitoxin system HicA family toxin n=1 Tax=unclassified Parabacteroides TaxID=2649774 RepID=UPI0024734BED|nr:MULTISPECIES: type II toxin-antitoxin system HicA family toxin [unclassified Parabacteroides]